MTLELDDVTTPTEVTSPYRGLMPYEEKDAEYFFGREADIVLIVNNARANRFGILYGPSGVGKSSVLGAGVVRSIRSENRMRYERFGQVETVVAYSKEWRDDPRAALREAVRVAFEQTPGVETFSGPPAGDPVAEILALREQQRVDLILILDQFEEFFLYHADESSAFAEDLAELTERGTRVHVLVSLREDALARLDDFEADIPDVFENTLRLDHLDGQAAQDAIRKPLDFYNSSRPPDQQVTIEDALVDELLRQLRAGRVQVDSTQDVKSVEAVQAGQASATHDAADRAGVRIEAPFLQLVLTRLWDEEAAQGSTRLRLSTLVALGGAQEIVRQHLDRVMQQFDEGELDVLADAFGHLVTPSGSKIAHRASDLAEFSGHDPARMRALLRRLAEGDQRILRDVPPPMDQPHAEPRYEIFHDVLALAVLDWRRRYLAEAEARRQQVALIADNMRAEQEAKEAKRRLRRARSVVAGMGLLLLAGVALAIWALASRHAAEQAKADAVSSREDAVMNGVLDDVNRLMRTDPAAALIEAQKLNLDPARDPQGRFQDAYRRALDAADTEVVLDLGSPVVLAATTQDLNLITVTEDRHVRLWHTTGMNPVRLDTKQLVDTSVPGETSERVAEAVTVDDGKFVVVRTDAGEVSSVDLSSGDVQKLDIHLGPDSAIAASDDGSGDVVVAYNYEKKATLWHVADNTTSDLPGLKQSLAWAAIDSTDEYLALTVYRDAKVFQQVWSVSTHRRLGEVEVTSHTGQTIYYARASFTGRDPELLVLGTGYQTEAALWNYSDSSLTPLGGEDGHWRQAYDSEDIWDSAADNDDEKFDGLMAIAGDKEVKLYDAVGDGIGELRTQTVDGPDWATHVERNPADTSEFAVVSRDGYVELYRQLNLTPPHPIWTYRGHQGQITDVTFLYDEDGKDAGDADAAHLVTASRDGTVRIWRHPAPFYDWYIGQWVLGSEFTPDGKWLLGLTPFRVTRSDGQNQVGELIKVLHDEVLDETYGQAVDMSPSPDGRYAVVADEYCQLPIVQPMVPKAADVALGHPAGSTSNCASAVAWNPDPDRHQIVAGTDGNTLVSWDSTSGELTGTLRLGAASSEVQDVAISGDGKTIVAVTGTGAAGSIQVVDAEHLTRIKQWPASDLDFVAISADGRYVATSGNDRHLVQVWDVDNPDEPVNVFRQASSTGTLSHVVISPDADASRVAVTTSKGEVYVWDRASGLLLSVEKVHADAANEVAFNPKDIDQMVSAGDDGEMVRSICELCSVDTVAGLRDFAQDRMAQLIGVAVEPAG